MSTSIRRSAEQLAAEVGGQARRLLGSLRRTVIDRSRRGAWKLLGYENVSENLTAELFGGVGFHSRPAAGGKAEAIVALIGGAGAPVIVATRDEGLRQAMAELAEDETAIFNTVAIVLVKADGTVEIRSGGGVATPVALASDLAALKSALSGWTPVAGDGGAALKTILTTFFASWPNPATVLKAE